MRLHCFTRHCFYIHNKDTCVRVRDASVVSRASRQPNVRVNILLFVHFFIICHPTITDKSTKPFTECDDALVYTHKHA